MEELLERVKKYREQLSKPPLDNSFIEILEDINLSESIKSNRIKVDDKDNVYVKCNINKNESTNGCTKKVKITRTTKNNKKESKTIQVNIPAGIENGQSIVLLQEGNYIEDKGINSNVVINIKVK